MYSYNMIIGYACTILTCVTFLPQLYHMWDRKQTKDVSMYFLIMNQFMYALWIYYGIIIDNWPIIICDAFISIINILMILTKIYFDRKNQIQQQSG